METTKIRPSTDKKRINELVKKISNLEAIKKRGIGSKANVAEILLNVEKPFIKDALVKVIEGPEFSKLYIGQLKVIMTYITQQILFYRIELEKLANLR